MMVRIGSDGTLIIEASGGVEAYALKKWIEENTGSSGQISVPKMLITHGCHVLYKENND